MRDYTTNKSVNRLDRTARSLARATPLKNMPHLRYADERARQARRFIPLPPRLGRLLPVLLGTCKKAVRGDHGRAIEQHKVRHHTEKSPRALALLLLLLLPAGNKGELGDLYYLSCVFFTRFICMVLRTINSNTILLIVNRRF